MPGLSPADVAGPQAGGRRRSGASVKTLKKVLKKAGLKVTGKKAALTRRAKKARLMRGGVAKPLPAHMFATADKCACLCNLHLRERTMLPEVPSKAQRRLGHSIRHRQNIRRHIHETDLLVDVEARDGRAEHTLLRNRTRQHEGHP